MNCNAASNIWDSFKDGKTVPFRAESGEVLTEKILNPEQEEELMEIMDSLDKSSAWATEGRN